MCKSSGAEIECHCGKTDMRLKGCVRCSRELTRIMPYAAAFDKAKETDYFAV